MHAVDKRLFRAHFHTLFFVLLLAGVTIFAYRPAWNGGFLWDDDDYVVKNDLLTASDGLQRIWFSLDSPSQYFPLVYTTFRIEHALWGLNPSGYHWVNLLLHVANALLVWRVLARLNVPGAWLAGAIFALHPVQAESVAWITERKNVLMGFFFLLTLLAWIAFIDERTKRPWCFYALALIALRTGAFSQKHRLYFASCVALDSLAEKNADYQTASNPDHTLCCPEHRHGFAGSLVGTLPSGYNPNGVSVSEPDTANSRGEPCCLVLSEQTYLAV